MTPRIRRARQGASSARATEQSIAADRPTRSNDPLFFALTLLWCHAIPEAVNFPWRTFIGGSCPHEWKLEKPI
jgi:hypothetical protein